MEAKTKKTLKRVAIGSMAAVSLFLGVGSLLHTKAGRPFLAKLAPCPVKGSPELVAAARKEAIASIRGTSPAPARPALGFALDTTTLADVKTWATNNHVSCTESMGGTSLQCDDVPIAALPDHANAQGVIREITFGFRLDAHLQQIATLSNRLSPQDATTSYAGAVKTIAARVGAPTSGETETTPDHLTARDYALSTCAFRYSDYLATITVMNVAGSGILIREQFLSATES